ncbi:MAG: DUF4864 domain-containing protein [Chthoniobacterales bacterium]
MPRFAKASLLFVSCMICAGAFLAAHKFRAQAPPPAPHDLFAIVNRQLTAFRAADFQGAYRQAATRVQQKFTLPQFEKLVRQHYPEITRSCRVEFGAVRMRGENALVQVFFFDDDGSARSFLFSLVNEEDAWRIDDVEEMGEELLRCPFAGTQA